MSKENLYTPGCIRTFTGKYFNPCKPDASLICIEDIAHALSMQPLFGGHLPVWYSVAQHSILTSSIVTDEYKLSALLHDASEAYLIDVPRPVKEQLSNYKEIESNLMVVIAGKFGFDWPLHGNIKDADEDMLMHEWNSLMLNTGEWNLIESWDQPLAKAKFIEVFYRLTNPTK